MSKVTSIEAYQLAKKAQTEGLTIEERARLSTFTKKPDWRTYVRKREIEQLYASWERLVEFLERFELYEEEAATMERLVSVVFGHFRCLEVDPNAPKRGKR